VPERPTTVEVVPRVERALVVLAAHAQQLDGRLEHLEHRLDQADEARLDAPTHDDVLQVRVHSARLAAELARVTVELRAEIEDATHAAHAAHAASVAVAASLAEAGDTPRDRRIATLAEQIIDLSDAIDTMPADVARQGSSTDAGWAATA
jgi:hypothetical protein